MIEAFMSGLLPTELHDYSLLDIVRGIRAVKQADGSITMIPLPGLGEGIPIRSARAAVIVAIKALGLAPGSQIGVPLYCCPVVFKAVRAAGCIPRFIDINPETFCISSDDLKKKCSSLDSIIAVHMYGNSCDMLNIIDIMGNKPVIEDCAQSLGSKIGNRPCGSFGDISFFSFRSGKYLSVGEGGALYTATPGLSAHISDIISALPAPTRRDEIRHIIETYLRSKLRSRPLWGLVGKHIWDAYNKRTTFSDKSPIVLGSIFASDLAEIRRRMPQLDIIIKLQRSYAEYYEKYLIGESFMLCRQASGLFFNRFMYPVLFASSEKRDYIASYLKSRGVGTSKPYEDVIEGAAKQYGYERDCPVAELALKRTLVIPNYYSLKPRDIERIARLLNKTIAEPYFTKQGG